MRRHTLATLTSGVLVLACAGNEAPSADTAPGDTTIDADVDDVLPGDAPADGDADADASTPPPLAERVIGPSGGTLESPDASLRLIVPAGALPADTTLSLSISTAAPPAGVTTHSPIYRIAPAGLAFLAPVTLELSVPASVATPTTLRVAWSVPDQPGAFQELETRLRRRSASNADALPPLEPALVAVAQSHHLSLVFLADPNNPGSGSWYCCEPKDPLTHTTSDCLAGPPGGLPGFASASNCDPALCALTPGYCSAPSSTAGGCCDAIDPAADHPYGCATMPDWSECVNSAGSGVCQWVAQCGQGTPGALTCASCSANAHEADYQSSFALVGPTYAPLTCAELQALTIPTPTVAETDPLYLGQLGKWCGYQSALTGRCGLGGCPGLTCGDCLAMSADPDFATAYQAGHLSYQGLSCPALGAQNVPQPPFAVGLEVQTGRWCAWQAAGATAGCTFMSTAGQCPGLDLCAVDPSLCPSGLSCATCDAFATDPAYQLSYWLTGFNYAQMSCQDLQSANVPAPLSNPGDPAFPGELGKWCGYQTALGAACATPSSGCDDDCAACLTLASHPDFAAAFQGAQASYTGMSCAQLDAQNVPLPPFTTAVETQTGRWCAWQHAGASAGCALSTGAGQCQGMNLCALSPSLCPVVTPTCADCGPYRYSADYLQAWAATVNAAAGSTCQALSATPAPAPSTGPPNPLYPGQLGAWCGHMAAIDLFCGGGGCVDPCANCALHAGHQDFTTAWQAGQTAYAGMDCQTLDLQNVPPPPYSAGVETQSGRWCAFQEAGTAAGCGSGSPAGTCPHFALCVVFPSACP